jgi:hypothetical protein
MLARFRHDPLVGNVLALVALFIALGGGVAFAVTQIDANSVRSKHIVNGQVKERDLGDDAVTGDKTLESSLGEVPSAANAAQLGGRSRAEFGNGVLGGATAGRSLTPDQVQSFYPLGFTTGQNSARYVLPVDSVITGLVVHLSNAPTGTGSLTVRISNVSGNAGIACTIPAGQTDCFGGTAFGNLSETDRIGGSLITDEFTTFNGDVEFGYRLTN